MFTGLVEKIGRLESLQRSGDDWVITISHTEWDRPLQDGESVAVQGCCLTVASFSAGQFVCNVLDETLARTNLGSKASGAALNMERAMRMGDRLGGHLVSGHVDAVGSVESLRQSGADKVLKIGCSEQLTAGIVVKGSVSLDGVSLTVTAVDKNSFEVHIIPVTWEKTTLGQLNVGDSINVETDMLGKFVRKQMDAKQVSDGVTWDDLGRAGFL